MRFIVCFVVRLVVRFVVSFVGVPATILAGTILVTFVWPGRARAQGKDLDGVVNLNTASAELLELLPGVGPAKVRTIVVYRQKHPFRTVDELVRIKGIGRKMVRRLRPHLAISGPTTARAIHRAPGGDPLASAPPPRAPLPARKVIMPAPPPRRVDAGKARSPPAGGHGRRSLADHCPRPP